MGAATSLLRTVSTLAQRIFPSRKHHAQNPSSTLYSEQESIPADKDEFNNGANAPRIPVRPASPLYTVSGVQHLERVDLQHSGPDRPSSHVDKIIRRPLDYLLSLPGKKLRTQLILSFNEWFKVPDDKLQTIIEVVELLHTASLLVDDIQDSSKLRRGQPAAHIIYGSAQTINSANFAYFLAEERLAKLGSLKSLHVFIAELLDLHRGQGLELYYRDSLICPTEAEYMEIVTHKTGGLFRLAVGLLQSQSDVSVDCSKLADTLGIIYQIRDDYQNLQSDQGKGYGEDLTEGKFSFPMIHSISSAPNNTFLIDILRQRTEDEALKLAAISYIESTGSFEYCRQRLDSFQAEALRLVEQLEVNLGPGHRIRHILRRLEVTS
ncbi:isoprenoid synthase domain-containing protein [Aspergillus terricola var. indicus]